MIYLNVCLILLLLLSIFYLLIFIYLLLFIYAIQIYEYLLFLRCSKQFSHAVQISRKYPHPRPTVLLLQILPWAAPALFTVAI